MFGLGAIATGGKIPRQTICPLRKELWLNGYLGVEPRGIGSLWMKATVTFLGGSIIREAGRAAFSVIPWHFPYN
jgi:hypothetical protein